LPHLFVESCLEDDVRGIEARFWNGILNTAVDKINAHEGFTQAFAYGLLNTAENDSPLAILANDQETSLALKRMVHEFRGVTKTNDLPLLRRTVATLQEVLLNE